MAMRRDDCVRLIAEQRGEAVIVATYQAAFDLIRIAPHPLNYLSVGAMGQASSHALGLALGCPERRVIVLDGDGSLLMNLSHFVCHNGCYEANGAHPLPNAAVDFAAIARGAGISDASAYDDISVFASALPGLLTRPGPVFAALQMVPGDPSPQDYEAIHGAETRARFKAALK
jgi:sulfopyruvate decarboxylase subunit beta